MEKRKRKRSTERNKKKKRKKEKRQKRKKAKKKAESEENDLDEWVEKSPIISPNVLTPEPSILKTPTNSDEETIDDENPLKRESWLIKPPTRTKSARENKKKTVCR
eukprot:TRINITY_DN10417_c0_g1_i1.p1 TRINITY_DN10417_c0_g1~~TRINITY_DN10417_c0_g1_i1.p1  ORF type:complete len:106 (+),score=30.61 TRINITY_DN10417_c0_g1_i1:458-775(+)